MIKITDYGAFIKWVANIIAYTIHMGLGMLFLQYKNLFPIEIQIAIVVVWVSISVTLGLAINKIADQKLDLYIPEKLHSKRIHSYKVEEGRVMVKSGIFLFRTGWFYFPDRDGEFDDFLIRKKQEFSEKIEKKVVFIKV